MAALTAPRDTAEGTWAYSTNGSDYTNLANVIDAQPDPILRKIIDRMLVGGDTVLKFASRANYGKLKITQEWMAVLYTVFSAVITTKTQAFYLRYTWADTGGGGNTTFIYAGPPESISPPATPADNKVAQFDFVLNCSSVTYAAGS